jgi:hypothetical protein
VQERKVDEEDERDDRDQDARLAQRVISQGEG